MRMAKKYMIGNMKIAILTSGILPIPAVQGGAVENLIDFYLEYNDRHKLHDITVYSVFHPKVRQHQAHNSIVNHYYYVNINSYWARIKRKLYCIFRKDEPYNHFIGYYLYQSMKHLTKHDYDIIILENRPYYALKLYGKTKAKIIYHLHNDLLTTETPMYHLLYDIAYKIITVSKYITNRVKTINPNDTKCTTVYNGIDLQVFAPNSEIYINRRQLGLCENDFVIIFSGRINKDKGISELIDALLLLSDYPKIKLLIIGSSFFADATKDDDFLIMLKNKTKSIKDRIFFTGFIPYKEVPSHICLADIAVLPSIWEEPFGLTIVEAMATGLPVITTNSGGIPEICDKVAIKVNRIDIVNNLAAAIIYLYEHPEKRKQMAIASHERAKLFDKNSYTRNFFSSLET